MNLNRGMTKRSLYQDIFWTQSGRSTVLISIYFKKKKSCLNANRVLVREILHFRRVIGDQSNECNITSHVPNLEEGESDLPLMTDG